MLPLVAWDYKAGMALFGTTYVRLAYLSSSFLINSNKEDFEEG
jgi:hypothetical protein